MHVSSPDISEDIRPELPFQEYSCWDVDIPGHRDGDHQCPRGEGGCGKRD